MNEVPTISPELKRLITAEAERDQAIDQRPRELGIKLVGLGRGIQAGEAMNRANAKRIAETVTREELADMFARARMVITDWTKACPVNPAVSIGWTWNLMWPLFKKGERLSDPVIKNMVWAFGDYLDESLKPEKKTRRTLPVPHHQAPIFD